MELRFKTVERLGKLADDHAGIIQSISGGEYLPNPQAVGFDLEAVIREIDTERPDLDDAASASDKDIFRVPKHGQDEFSATDLEPTQTAFAKGPPDVLDFRLISPARCAKPSEDYTSVVHRSSDTGGEAISPKYKKDTVYAPYKRIGGGVSLKSPADGSKNSDDGSTLSGPTDPLGITVSAPSAFSQDDKSSPRKKPLTWEDLRQVPQVARSALIPKSRVHKVGDTGASMDPPLPLY